MPVALLVPEEGLVTTMRTDVVCLRGCGHTLLVMALGHQRRLSAWTHAAEGIASAEGFRAGVPLFGVAALVGVAAWFTWGHREGG